MARLPDVAMSRRQVLGLGALAAGAGLGLSACGSPVPLASSGPPLDGEYTGPPVQLEYWNGFTGGDGPAMREIVARFNESQDLIRVRMNVVQWAQYYQRVVAAVHAGKGPDIGAMHVEQLATQAARQTIAPITDIVDELGVTEDEYPAEVWERGTYAGERYGIPFDVHSLASYANLDVLEANGVRGLPEARQDFEASLATLMGAGVQNPFWVPNRWPAHLIFLSLLWQFGGEPYSEDGSSATFDSEAGVEALQWLVTQIQTGVSPENVAPDSQYTAFKNGEGAYTWDGIWQINDLLTTAPDLRWGLSPIPTIGEQPAVWANSHQLVMFKSRAPDDNRLLATKTFMRYLVENSEVWSQAGMVPARAAARESEEFLASPQATIAEAVPTMRFLPSVAAIGEVQAQTLEVGLANAILGRESPQEALAGAAAQASQLMQSNLRKFEG